MVRAAVALVLLAASARIAPVQAQSAPTPPAGSSWVEAGGFYHYVSNEFGNWKGGYARAVLSSPRNVWYLDVRAQEAFHDSGVYGSLANVHSFSNRFYTQVGIGGGTGDYVLPDLRADASLNFKLGGSRAVVVTVGGTWVESKDVFRDKAVFGSLTWYPSDVLLVEAGGRVNWSEPNTVRSARGSAAMTVGRMGSAVITLRGSAGTEGYQLTGAPETLQKFRSQEATISWRQWITAGFGTVVGGEWYHNPSYARAGVMAGVFHAW